MILVVEYRHEKIKKYRGSTESLAKRLLRVMKDLDYRNHWFQYSQKEVQQLRRTFA